ncbi:MAG: helix-turn-helix domain-containing protein [Chloroflexi bacterium]|nr:helix-turn-helix domain-containing protein [Chloroflexota bacterium]
MIEIAPSQVYTIRDVAEYLKCSTRKIHRLIAGGELRGFKIGNQRRIKGEEILQFIERLGGGAVDPMVAPAVQSERLYSLREAALILGVEPADIAHMLRAGKLPGFRVGMDWRCWGRDLIRLSGAADDGTFVPRDGTSNTVQPPLLPDEPGLKVEPDDDPSAAGAEPAA